ncbi:MAG: HNH endonuclease family protein, partial [bacterium]|nr:HNH endonuclease family protein [bacterium]
NNRGKDLTNMEKLKSYFMYQMYVFSPPDEIETNVTYIANIFKTIYLTINDLKMFDEDRVLIYHCQAYINGFSYRKLDDIKTAFRRSENKVEWIKICIVNLQNTFLNFKRLETNNNPFIKDLVKLDSPAFIYPFIIKGYAFLDESSDAFTNLAHLMEILVFRYKMVNSRADIYSRINSVLQNFSGDTVQLATSLKQKLNSENYWSDLRLRENLNGFMYDNSVINYLLWKYEESIQNSGYKIGNVEIIDEQIEHISPQTPTNGDPVKSGYEVDESGKYSDVFQMKILNSLGNLILISRSHNCSIGNKSFSEKLQSYNDNPLLNQQAEIREYLIDNCRLWNSQIIQKRHEVLLTFALSKWSFDSVL